MVDSVMMGWLVGDSAMICGAIDQVMWLVGSLVGYLFVLIGSIGWWVGLLIFPDVIETAGISG